MTVMRTTDVPVDLVCFLLLFFREKQARRGSLGVAAVISVTISDQRPVISRRAMSWPPARPLVLRVHCDDDQNQSRLNYARALGRSEKNAGSFFLTHSKH